MSGEPMAELLAQEVMDATNVGHALVAAFRADQLRQYRDLYGPQAASLCCGGLFDIFGDDHRIHFPDLDGLRMYDRYLAWQATKNRARQVMRQCEDILR